MITCTSKGSRLPNALFFGSIKGRSTCDKNSLSSVPSFRKAASGIARKERLSVKRIRRRKSDLNKD